LKTSLLPLEDPIVTAWSSCHRRSSQYNKEVSFFDFYQRFHPSNHLFRNDTRSFLKNKTVRKGSPKGKLGVDIVQVLNDLKESESGVFEGYDKNHNWTHKSCLCELPYAKVLILPHNIYFMHQE
jgi:hypothetical protein